MPAARKPRTYKTGTTPPPKPPVTDPYKNRRRQTENQIAANQKRFKSGR